MTARTSLTNRRILIAGDNLAVALLTKGML